MRLILKFLETRLQLDVINAKLGYKGPKFVHYEPTLIEKSVSNIPVIIIMVLIFPDFNIFTVSCTWYTNLSLFDPILEWWHHNMGLEF